MLRILPIAHRLSLRKTAIRAIDNTLKIDYILSILVRGSPLDEAALWPHLPTPGPAKAGLFFAYDSPQFIISP